MGGLVLGMSANIQNSSPNLVFVHVYSDLLVKQGLGWSTQNPGFSFGVFLCGKLLTTLCNCMHLYCMRAWVVPVLGAEWESSVGI